MTTTRNMAQIPRLTRPNQLAAPVRPETAHTAPSDDRLPPPTQHPMLPIVIQQPLLRPPSHTLMSQTTEPLVAHLRHEHPPAETALTRRKHQPRKHRRPPALPPTRTLQRAKLPIPMRREENASTRANLLLHGPIAPSGREKVIAGSSGVLRLKNGLVFGLTMPFACCLFSHRLGAPTHPDAFGAPSLWRLPWSGGRGRGRQRFAARVSGFM